MKVLSFGEILWDVYPDKRFIGGAPLNFAAHLAKHGAKVHMLSALGKDELGDASISRVKDFGIKDDFISYVGDKETGKCIVTLDENGIPNYNLLQNVAYDYITCDKEASGFDLLYFGSLALRSTYNLDSLKKLMAENSFGEVFVDVNIRPPFYSRESVGFCVENASIVKISSEELPVVIDLLGMENAATYNEFCVALAGRYESLKLIILTLGADGAFAYDCRAQKAYTCPGRKVEVASTVGAGDSFSAAFVYQYLNNKGLDFCLDYASKVAAFVVSNYEAIPEYSPEMFT